METNKKFICNCNEKNSEKSNYKKNKISVIVNLKIESDYAMFVKKLDYNSHKIVLLKYNSKIKHVINDIKNLMLQISNTKRVNLTNDFSFINLKLDVETKSRNLFKYNQINICSMIKEKEYEVQLIKQSILFESKKKQGLLSKCNMN